jgi:hypothetical protein
MLKLRAALRAAAWGDHEQATTLVREARNACDEWLAPIEDVAPSARRGSKTRMGHADGHG